MRYQPMLASPMSRGLDTPLEGWAVEEKIDGHRLLVEVTFHNMSGKRVAAFARPRGGDKRMLRRDLPGHLVANLARLDPGVYDGELCVPGGKSHDVTRKDRALQLTFMAFDILEHHGNPLGWRSYTTRREILEQAVRKAAAVDVRCTTSLSFVNIDAVMAHAKTVWARGGEGLILKRRDSTYEGKRSKEWVKIKKIHHEKLVVIGFEPGKLGLFAKVVVHDAAEGVTTTVKTVDDAQRERFRQEALKTFGADANLQHPAVLMPNIGAKKKHPAIGRELWIEHQGRLPSGQFRHPMWDRWAEDGE